MSVDVIIVGGGIAGLATAYELQRLGVSFTVLERGPRPGGVILSEEIDGFTIDAGPDSLLIQKPDGLRLCEEIGLGDRLVTMKPPRLAFVQRDGRLHALPAGSILGIPTALGSFLRTRLFSWPGKLRMGAELFIGQSRDGADESIGAFMTRRFGEEFTTYLAEPLLAGIHAGDVDRLSIQALFPRLAEMERQFGSLLRGFRRTPRAASADGAFKSLPGGLSEMVRALVKVLPAGSVCLNAAVTRISSSGNRLFRAESDRGDQVEARAIALATPAYVTAALLRDHDRKLAGLCDDIRYVSTAAVALAFSRGAVAHPLNGSGFVVPRVERSGILAASWLSSKWPYRAPDGRVLIRAFVGGARHPQALGQSDAELVAVSLGALGPILGIRSEPLFSRVYRWERANAQHEVGHLARLRALDVALAEHPGLFMTGSAFRGVGIPDCVADGRATAARIAQHLHAPQST